MKRFLEKYFPVIPVGLILGTVLFSHSCANTTTPPSGGPKDTIPPVLVEIFPYPGATHVPVHKTHLMFKFDEFVTVKDQQSIFLSPPMEKRPKYRLKGKSVIVSFENDLDSNGHILSMSRMRLPTTTKGTCSRDIPSHSRPDIPLTQ